YSRQPGPRAGAGRCIAGWPAEAPAVVAPGDGGDRGRVAAGAGGVPLGEAGGTSVEEQGATAGWRGTAAAVADPQSDAPGGGPGVAGGRRGAVTPFHQGDQELLAGTGLLLPVGGRPAGEQRPGAPVRQPPLSRAPGQPPAAGLT